MMDVEYYPIGIENDTICITMTFILIFQNKLFFGNLYYVIK